MVLSLGLSLALSLPFAGCGGKSSGKDGSATIGAKGGTVTLSGGPTLTIPPGALSADTTITITALSDQPTSGALSPVYQFGPEGTTFAAPVTVTFPLSTSGAQASVLWSAPGTPLTYEAPATTVAGTTATAEVTHFSNGGVFGPLQDGDPCLMDSDHVCKVGRLSHWYQLWSCNLTTENVPDGLHCWLPINTQNFSGRPTWLGAAQTPWDGTCSAGICVPPASYLISGTVTPSGGAEGTEVFLSGTLSAYTYTDAKGFYQFRVVNGSYTLTPVAVGHTYTPATRAVTVAGKNVTGLDFARSSSLPTHTLSGTVSGAVSAGVAVAVSGDATASTTTDALGNYSFQVEDGSYTVTPSLSGYLFTPSNIPLTVNGADLPGQNFTSAGITYSISGTVSGAQPGVTMTLGGSASATTVTDGNGVYHFTGLAGGSYTVTPSMTGYTFLPVSSTVLLTGADVTGEDFAGTATSNPTYTISGTVSGDVVAGVTISLDGSSSTVTDASGAYSFSGIANGNYWMTATLAGYTFTPSEIDLTVSDGDVPQQNFVSVQTTGTVIVTVLTPGTLAPLANAPVYVTPWNNGQVGGSGYISPTVTTDANGTATFAGIAAGTFNAQAKLTNTLLDASSGTTPSTSTGLRRGRWPRRG